MFIANSIVPGWLAIASWVILVLSVAAALRYADWRALRLVPGRLHLLFGGALFCLLLWLLSVRVIEGLWIHFLGMTTLTLILGWRFAIIAGSVAMVLHTLVIGESLAAMSPAWLLTVAIPASISRLLVWALRRVKSRNLFIYMLGAGFGGGALSMLAVALVAVVLFQLIGQQAWVAGALENWPLLSLMMFPEGFINGMVVTTLTVFYPDLVKTFDDRHYLDGA